MISGIFPKYALAVLAAAVSLIWLALVCLLAERFNVPSADGIMYSLPFAGFKGFANFGIPFLRNFEGYGEAWGHNWPGSMWIKAAFYSAVPYSRMTDVGLASAFQLLTAFACGIYLRRATASLWPSVAAFVILLSDRILLLSVAGNRPEAFAVALVVVLFLCVSTGRDCEGFRFHAAIACAFLCASLHPYSLVLSAVIIGGALHRARRRNGSLGLRDGGLPLAFILGCGSMAAWFLMSPAALAQFTANLALQNSFYQSWNAVFQGLGNYRLGAGHLLWFVAATAGIGRCLARLRHPPAPKDHAVAFWETMAVVLFFTVILLHTATRCENFHYLAFGAPFAVIIVISAAVGISKTGVVPAWVAVGAVVAIMVPHAVILPHRLLQFQRAGFPDLGTEYASVLGEIDPRRAVYIPHSLWPAATLEKDRDIRWFTFPVASSAATRKRYEAAAYADAKPGDILIIENGGAAQEDRFGVYPTFAILPPDPRVWRHVEDQKKIFPGSVPWGIDLSIYEYRDDP